MCRAVTCETCGKTSWAGCGEHVAQVKAGVPASEWCDGRHAPAETPERARGGFFSRLFGR